MFKLLLFSLSSTLFFAQDFTIKAGYGIGFHLEQQEGDDPNVPNNFEDIEDVPSIGQYYDSGKFYEFTGILHFVKEDPYLEEGHFLIGLSYFNESANVADDENFILGKKLTITTFAPFFGYASYFLDGYETGYYYFNLGVGINTYSGSGTVEGINISTKYSKSTGLYFSGGLYNQLNENFGIDLSFDVKYNSTSPEEFTLSNSIDKETFPFEETQDLKDLMFRFKVSIGYTL